MHVAPPGAGLRRAGTIHAKTCDAGAAKSFEPGGADLDTDHRITRTKHAIPPQAA